MDEESAKYGTDGRAARPRDEHDSIRTAARRLLDVTLAERGYRAVAPGLLHALVAAVETHLADEESRTGLATADPLIPAWRAYVAAWDGARVADDWPGFAAATQALVSQMLARIDAEDRARDRPDAG